MGLHVTFCDDAFNLGYGQYPLMVLLEERLRECKTKVCHETGARAKA